MLQPSKEEFELLPLTGRRLYRLCDWLLRRADWASPLWLSSFVRVWVWLCVGRRYRIYGQDQLDSFSRETSAIIAANHRSFFDFSVITYVTVIRSRLTRRVLFPVRVDFIYERWLGGLMNAAFTGLRMFPPIMRGKDQVLFNRFSVARMVEELAKPGIFVGIHPEGRRNKGRPCDFLPAQPGVGKLVLEAENARVIPVFIEGLGDNMLLEMWRNWWEPKNWPVEIHFGSDIDFSDLRQRGSRASTQLLAARRCMGAISDLCAGHPVA